MNESISEEYWAACQRVEQSRVECSNRKSAEVQLALATLPRACRFKVGDTWTEGTVHAWSTDFEDYETGPALYPVGIVEDAKGKLHSVYVIHMTFEPKPEPPPPQPNMGITNVPRSRTGLF